MVPRPHPLVPRSGQLKTGGLRGGDKDAFQSRAQPCRLICRPSSRDSVLFRAQSAAVVTRRSHQVDASASRASIAVLLVRNERLEQRRDGEGNNLTKPWRQCSIPGAPTGSRVIFQNRLEGFLLQVGNQICAMPLEHDHKRMMLNNALPFSGSPDTEIFKTEGSDCDGIS